MAKTTTNLGLYEAESTDGSNTYNITTMLNNNWDKIDADSKTKSDGITSINSAIGTAILSTTDKTLKGAVNEVKNNIPTVPSSLPANGGNATTVNNKTAASTPQTTEKIDLIGMVNEVKTTASSDLNNAVTGVTISDFTGKVTGSVVANPNIAKRTAGDDNQTRLLLPNEFIIEIGTNDTGIATIEKLDGSTLGTSTSISSAISQHLFEFDLISIVERKYGTIPGSTTADKVDWLKNNLASIICNWYGYGSCPSGNKAYANIFQQNSWTNIPTWSHTLNIPNLISPNAINSTAISQSIDSNGFIYFLAYTDASDGTTPSTIYTDYIDIQLTFKNIFSALMLGEASLDSHKADYLYQTAGGTATAITLTINETLINGLPVNFIASASNSGSATTINSKHFYKPNTTTAPNLIAEKPYTAIYNSSGDCFFIKASAEGNAIASHVLAGDTFSNDNDTGLVGTAPLKSGIAYTPTTSDQVITAGFEDGTCKVKGDSNLVSDNIVIGKSIFEVTGSYSSITPGDKILIAGTSGGVTDTTWKKVSSIQLNITGTYRIRFGLYCGTTGVTYTSYGRIYKNGVAFGIQRSIGSTTPAYYIEDLFFTAGDTCEFWAMSTSSDRAAVIFEPDIRYNQAPVLIL